MNVCVMATHNTAVELFEPFDCVDNYLEAATGITRASSDLRSDLKTAAYPFEEERITENRRIYEGSFQRSVLLGFDVSKLHTQRRCTARFYTVIEQREFDERQLRYFRAG